MAGSRLRRVGSCAAALLLALALPLATAVPAAADGPTSFSNSAAIAVPAAGSPFQMGDASPYPSPITVSGMTGSVTNVTVTLTGVTHGIFNDIDALLVGPTGQNLMVVSDASDTNTFTFANNATLTFSDAGTAMPTGGSIPSGTYKPTNRDDGKPDVFAGFTVSGQTTFAGAFTGLVPNGSWKLYVHDDTSGDVGQIAGGWSMSVTTSAVAATTSTTVTTSGSPSTTGAAATFTATVTSGGAPVTEGSVTFSDAGTNLGAAVALNGAGKATLTTSALSERTHSIVATYGGTTAFLTSNGSVTQVVDNATTVTGSTYCNTGQLTVPTNGPATPYGSHITVSGVAGNATKVTAQLLGVSHQVPTDLDVLLVGPTGIAATLLSDVGGQNPVTGVNLTFDDAAASSVSTTSLASGTFKPTDDDTTNTDNFPPPAPSTAAPASFSGFVGTSANGIWTLYVNDDATADSGSISGGWCVTVLSQAATATALSSSNNPSSVGDPVTFTAAVTSAGSPVTAGSVVFTVDGTPRPAVTVGANGTATIATSTLAAGSHAVTADFGGTSSYAASTANLSQVVALHPTTTTLTSDNNPSDVGDPVTFTATVTSGGTPVTSGSVILTVDGTPRPAVTVDAGGTATFTTDALAAGTHSLKADYGATASYAASTATLDQDVALHATSLALTSDLNPSDVGDPVTFTATVTSSGAAVATGSVVFTIDGSAQPAVTVDATGTATFTTSSLTAATHTIKADYGATSNYASSTDDLSQVVALHPTDLTLASDNNPSDVGDPVTFTATVTSGGSPVTRGSVVFTIGSTPQPAVSVDLAGTATFTTSSLTAATHTIKADYGATATYTSSTDELDQVVSLRATDLTLSSDTDPTTIGDPVTFTATVTSGGTPVSSGAVVFSLDGTAQPEVNVDAAGTATFTTSDLTIGSHTIKADYAATSSYGASTDSLDQAVAPKARAGASYTVAEGGSVTLSAAGSTIDNATYEWDLDGDGDYTDATGSDPTLTWADLEALGINDGPSTHTISLRVTVGAQNATATATLAVTNTAPTPYTVGTPVATAGSPFTIKVGADDPSSADMSADFTYTIDWGDGSPVETVVGPADPPMTHTYAAVGAFSATFSVADKDGDDSGVGPGQLQIQVNAAPSTTTSTATTGQPTTSTSLTGGTTGATTASSGTATSDGTATSSTETSSTLGTATSSGTGTETAANTSTVTSWTTSTADQGASGDLPNTGVSIGAPLAAGALLLLAGGALLLAGRRPRSRRRH